MRYRLLLSKLTACNKMLKKPNHWHRYTGVLNATQVNVKRKTRLPFSRFVQFGNIFLNNNNIKYATKSPHPYRCRAAAMTRCPGQWIYTFFFPTRNDLECLFAEHDQAL